MEIIITKEGGREYTICPYCNVIYCITRVKHEEGIYDCIEGMNYEECEDEDQFVDLCVDCEREVTMPANWKRNNPSE